MTDVRALGAAAMVALLAACTERTPASELVYDSGVVIADAEAAPDADEVPIDRDANVGVDAPEPRPPPNWADDVLPIVSAQCLQCHGEVLANYAPMRLATYAQATAMFHSPRQDRDDFVFNLMAAAVSSVEAPMPAAMRLSAEQVDIIVRWAAAGAPERAGPTDAGVEDAAADAEVVDAEAADAEIVDAEAAEGGVPDADDDAAVADADEPDASAPDAAAPDAAALPDAAAPDAAAPDAAAPDAAAPDAAAPDAAAPDAAAPDAAAPDAAAPDAAAPDAATPPDAGVLDPLVGVGTVDFVAGGFGFIEGPLWMPAQDVLLFSDIGFNRIERMTLPNTITSFRDPSSGANGLALDPLGRLLSCEHTTHAITRSAATGGPTTLLVDRYQGLALNSPNDVTVRADGVFYFTDPPYALGPRPREIPFNGVFRGVITGTVTNLTAEWQGAVDTRPNGLVLSADESTLFMSDTAGNTITRFTVAPATGALSNPTLFVTTAAGPDGMAIDALGNVFVATSIGVEVYSPAGVRWGVIAVPRVPTNIAWGDLDRRTLYITGTDTLYRVRVVTAGVRD